MCAARKSCATRWRPRFRCCPCRSNTGKRIAPGVPILHGAASTRRSRKRDGSPRSARCSAKAHRGSPFHRERIEAALGARPDFRAHRLRRADRASGAHQGRASGRRRSGACRPCRDARSRLDQRLLGPAASVLARQGQEPARVRLRQRRVVAHRLSRGRCALRAARPAARRHRQAPVSNGRPGSRSCAARPSP